MNAKKYVGDNFLSSTFKIKYSTIKVVNLQNNHKIFYDYLMSNTKYLKTDNITERLYHVYNNLTENFLCSYCLKNIPKFQTFKTGYRECCSNKCSTKKSAKKNHQKKLKSGVYKKIVEKQQQTIKERYGALKNRKIRDKVKKTNQKKYGGNAPMCSDIIKEKMKNTCIQKYGVTNGGVLNNGYNWKNYIMPSGKIIKIQGYEDKALNELLKIYDEKDIIAIKKDIPKIKYYNKGKIRRYYPDIFIPKDNLIIEVKSKYTLEKNKEINELKFQAVKNAGFNFLLKIYK